jgi:hypothetical protein
VPWCRSWTAGDRPHLPRLSLLRCCVQNRRTLSAVMPGLDPGIHLLAKRMDRRIKSGDDSKAKR